MTNRHIVDIPLPLGKYKVLTELPLEHVVLKATHKEINVFDTSTGVLSRRIKNNSDIAIRFDTTYNQWYCPYYYWSNRNIQRYDIQELTDLANDLELRLDSIQGLVYIPKNTIIILNKTAYTNGRIYLKGTKKVNKDQPVELKAFNGNCSIAKFTHVELEQL